MSNNILLGSGDKLSHLATILLYVYRSKSNNKTFNIEDVTNLLDLIKSKNTDILNLKDIVKNILKEDIDKSTLLDALTLNLPEDSPILNKLTLLVNTELESKELDKYLNTMKVLISESTVQAVNESKIMQTAFSLSTKDLSLEERKLLAKQLKAEIKDDTESVKDGNADEMESVSISNIGGLKKLLDKTVNGEKLTLKTGWSDFNKAVAGGLATGELVDVEALSHKNKTGFTMSLFLQTLLNNKITLENGKKPLWIWISLEDDILQVVIKMFVYLYFRKYKQMPLILDLTNEDIEKFFADEIAATGNELVIKRINASKFTLTSYERLVRTYTLLGFRVVCTAIDYLEKGFEGTNNGAGNNAFALKAYVSGFRTYIQDENILCITPWQISADANTLLRNGLTDIDFLPTINGKGYTQGSKSLIQELDVQLGIHLVKINGIHYQAVQVGKLKRPVFVNPDDKYLLIPFEKNIAMGDNELMGPLMEDSSATNMIIKPKENESTNELDL